MINTQEEQGRKATVGALEEQIGKQLVSAWNGWTHDHKQKISIVHLKELFSRIRSLRQSNTRGERFHNPEGNCYLNIFRYAPGEYSYNRNVSCTYDIEIVDEPQDLHNPDVKTPGGKVTYILPDNERPKPAPFSTEGLWDET